MKYLYHVLTDDNISGFHVPGIEARGLIFGPPIALAIGAKFVPLRKPRKLPGIFNRLSLCFNSDVLVTKLQSLI